MKSMRGEKGASATEYAILTGLIGVVAIGAVFGLGINTSKAFDVAATELASARVERDGGATGPGVPPGPTDPTDPGDPPVTEPEPEPVDPYPADPNNTGACWSQGTIVVDVLSTGGTLQSIWSLYMQEIPAGNLYPPQFLWEGEWVSEARYTPAVMQEAGWYEYGGAHRIELPFRIHGQNSQIGHLVFDSPDTAHRTTSGRYRVECY